MVESTKGVAADRNMDNLIEAIEPSFEPLRQKVRVCSHLSDQSFSTGELKGCGHLVPPDLGRAV